LKFQKSWDEILSEAQAKAVERNADPFREKVEGLVSHMDAISTHSLLNLIGLPNTTGNGRRIAHTMRSLGGWVPIKSRRLEPGGWRDTVIRGWARPVRQSRCRTSFNQGETAGASPLNSPMRDQTN